MFEEKFIPVLKKKCYIFNNISLKNANIKIKEESKEVPTESEIKIIIKVLKMPYKNIYFIDRNAYFLVKRDSIKNRDEDTLYFKKLNTKNPSGTLILLSKPLTIEKPEIEHISTDLYYYWNLRKQVRDLLKIKNRGFHRNGDIGGDAHANTKEQENQKSDIQSLERIYKELFIQKIVLDTESIYISTNKVEYKSFNIRNSLEDDILKKIKEAEIVINYKPSGKILGVEGDDFYPRKTENLLDIYYKNNINHKKVVFGDAVEALNQYEYNKNDNQESDNSFKTSSKSLNNLTFQRMINPTNFFLLREKIASAEQSSIHLSKKKVLLIEGAAGTGKTTTAVTHIKKMLLDNENLNSKDIIFLVNNESGVIYLKDFTKELELKEISIFNIKKFMFGILNKNGISKDVVNIFIKKIPDVTKQDLSKAEGLSVNYLDKIKLIVDNEATNTKNHGDILIEYLLREYQKDIINIVISYELKDLNRNLNTLEEVDRIKFKEVKGYLVKKKTEKIGKKEELEKEINKNKSDTEIIDSFFEYSKELISILKGFKRIYKVDSLKMELQNLIKNNDFADRFIEITNKLREEDNIRETREELEKRRESFLSSLDKKKIFQNVGGLKLNQPERYKTKLVVTISTLNDNKESKNILYSILKNLKTLLNEFKTLKNIDKIKILAFKIIEGELEKLEKLIKSNLYKEKTEKKKEKIKIKEELFNLTNLLKQKKVNAKIIIAYSKDPYWLFRSSTLDNNMNKGVLNYLSNILNKYNSILYLTKLLLNINEIDITVLLSIIYSMEHFNILNKHKVIFIDEIQDITSFEIEICRIFTEQKLILAGDQLQKTTSVKNGISSWNDIYKYESLYKDNLFELSLNFRQTYELANASLNFRKKILNKNYINIKEDYFENQIGFYKPTIYFINSNNISNIVSGIFDTMLKKYENRPPITLVTNKQDDLVKVKDSIAPNNIDYYLVEKNGEYDINIISRKKFIFMEISNIKGKEFPIIVYWIPKEQKVTDNIIYLIMSRANFEVYILIENTDSLTANFKSFFNESTYLECKL